MFLLFVYLSGCFSVSNFVQKLPNYLHGILTEGWPWASEQMVKFLWQSPTNLPDGGTDIATLVRRALAEVCTVRVLLVTICIRLFSH